jgi:predicted HTH transcriptional regulator
MTIPESADGWTLDLLRTLCDTGHGETDQYDFKGRLGPSDQVTKAVCAFANTRGGYVVVGVPQDKERQFLIEGLLANPELSKELHDKVRADPRSQLPSLTSFL